MKYPDTTPRPTDPNSPAHPDHRTADTREGEPTVTSRLTTDGTRYLPETFASTDGTRELPNPMIDPMTGRSGFQTDWPIGDARRDGPGDGRTEPRR